MTIIFSDHKNEIQFFRNHLPCHWILKMIRAEVNDSTPLIKRMGYMATPPPSSDKIIFNMS